MSLPVVMNSFIFIRMRWTCLLELDGTQLFEYFFVWRSVGKRGQLDMEWKKHSYRSVRRQLLGVFYRVLLFIVEWVDKCQAHLSVSTKIRFDIETIVRKTHFENGHIS